MRITLEGAQVSAVVLTQDQPGHQFPGDGTEQDAQRQRDELAGEIAAQMYAAVVETHQQLLTSTPASRLTSHAIDGQSLSQARSELQHFERLLEGGGHERAV